MSKRILVFGDSIVWGAWDERGGWAARLKAYADREGIEGKEDNDEVYLLGVSGETSEDLRQRFKGEVRCRFWEGMGMVVLIAIGVNDSAFDVKSGENQVRLDRYEENLRAILAQAKNLMAEVVMVGLTPVDEMKVNPIPWHLELSYSNEQVERYNEVLRRVAGENHIGWIDIYGEWRKRDYKKLLADGIHPNGLGHEVISELVLRQLIRRQLLD